MQLLPKTCTLPEQVQHTQKWSKLVIVGWEDFTCNLLEHSKANPKPITFTILMNGDKFIYVAHGLGLLAMESNEHLSNGLIGVVTHVLGDRLIMDFQRKTSHCPGTHIHDII